MLSLPKTTEMSKQLPKKAIYTKFNMNTVTKEKFDADIKKITIVNEISVNTTTINKGKQIAGFYVLLVLLKHRDFDDNIIQRISKLINQNILFILQYEEDAKLAVYCTKLIQTKWSPINEVEVKLIGLNLDDVWENIVVQVGKIEIEEGNSLEEQIIAKENKLKLQKKIANLEKQARVEKQPKKKFELFQQIKKLQKELENKLNG